MAEGDLITDDWQQEWAGLLLGDGSSYALVQVQGLLDQPETVASDRGRLRRHGLLPGDDFLAARTTTWTWEVSAETEEEFHAAVQALMVALTPAQDEAPLAFRIPGVAAGSTAVIYGRPRKRSLPIDLDYLYGVPLVTVEVASSDPRIYAAQESSAQAVLSASSGGLTFSASPPFTFGAVSTGNLIQAENAGNFDAPVLLRIDGPCTNPAVTNETQDRSLALSLELAAGEFLLIDTETRTVLLNGTESRYSSLTSAEWWDLRPGTETVRFQASSPTSALLTMTWRSAWV